jgi:hypothetical protein
VDAIVVVAKATVVNLAIRSDWLLMFPVMVPHAEVARIPLVENITVPSAKVIVEVVIPLLAVSLCVVVSIFTSELLVISFWADP